MEGGVSRPQRPPSGSAPANYTLNYTTIINLSECMNTCKYIGIKTLPLLYTCMKNVTLRECLQTNTVCVLLHKYFLLGLDLSVMLNFLCVHAYMQQYCQVIGKHLVQAWAFYVSLPVPNW